jgi:excisionase family DNA binding protein
MDTVLKVGEVARLLRIHPVTVYRLLKNGSIPAFRLGSEWRFSQETIERWIKEHAGSLNQKS